ncbi:hypothetical protein PPSIR1_05861 [Plesiocystis pacifica SIR-1]|uniref:Carboxypeptidase regulatory-like domain-containing protein n=2 Tax=Plesiocystis pacifica TaxID=191768 RepID=A6GIP1_9BACT|nr:hypothetical protein PPSIR1_05861 [Plesiocystis pacifica SIR-1]
MTDERGRFRLGPDADSERIWISASDHLEIMRSAPALGLIEFVAVPESTISGKVLHARTGAPVAGAKVSSMAQNSLSFESTQTDEAGAFRLRGLPPDDYEVSVEGFGVKGEAAKPLRLGFREHLGGVVIQAHPGAHVAGTVELGDTGRACRGWVRLRARGLEYAGSGLETSRIDDGKVEFEALSPGTYDVTIDCYGHREFESPPLIVRERNIGNIQWRVPVGSEPEPTVPMSESEPRWTGAVRGRVIDEQGLPVSGINVKPRYPGKRVSPAETRTDADGNFLLDNLPSGRLEFHVYTDWQRWWRADLGMLSGQEIKSINGSLVEAEIVIESRHGSLMGGFFDEQGLPVAGALVVAFESSDSFSPELKPVFFWKHLGEFAVTDEGGRFMFEGLAEREHAVYAYRPGGGEASARLIEPESSLELTITPGGTLAGTVTGLDGAKLRSFYVRARDTEEQVFVHHGFWRTNGEWRFDNLPAGHYEVSVEVGEYAAEVEVELGEGEHQEGIELRLAPSSE